MRIPAVSIIIPVYNAKDYLGRCMDSILGQELQDFGLLLVNNRSMDSPRKTCDDYTVKGKRVYVTHKNNTGTSDTRNMVISHAKEKYLQFVDSDDWLTPDATKLMVCPAEENHCDMVITDFYRVTGERVSHKGDIEEGGVMDQEMFTTCMMENPSDFHYGVLWNKLCRREIVERYHLRMDEEISWCEDFMFNLEYIRHAKSFYALQTLVYYYLKRKGFLVTQGMSISKTVKTKLMVFEYYNNFYKYVLDKEGYERSRLQVYKFLVDSAADGIVLPALLPDSKKLGAERNGVYVEAVLEDGIITKACRSRKLLERYLEPAALKHDLSLTEISLLLYFYRLGKPREVGRVASVADSGLSKAGIQNQPGCLFNRRKLADIMGIPRPMLSASIQKLVARGSIRVEDIRTKKGMERQIRVLILPAADSLLEDLAVMEQDYHQARSAGFGGEELEQYTRISERMKENVQKILQQKETPVPAGVRREEQL